MHSVPYADKLTLTNANTAYNLFLLLTAAEPTLPRPAQSLIIQADYHAPNTAEFTIGDTKMQTDITRYGILILPGSSFSLDSMGANLIILDQICVACNTSGQNIFVTVVTR